MIDEFDLVPAWQEVGHLVDDTNRIFITNLGDRIIFTSNS